MLTTTRMLRLIFICCFATLVTASGDVTDSDPFGGPSWEFEKYSCKIKWPDVSKYPEEELERRKRITPLDVGEDGGIPSDRAIAEYINTFKPTFETINERLQTLFMTTRMGYVEGRLKSVESVKKNIMKSNKSLSDFGDIIGFRVTSRTVSHVLQAKSTLMNDVVNFTIKKLKCYGICPGAGNYREDGYRRIHILVEVKKKGAEIQLSTPYMTLFADYTHDLVYKGPKVISKNSDVLNYTLRLAEYYYNLDVSRDKLPSCPLLLQVAQIKDILTQSMGSDQADKVYKKLGEPPDACQWWNDLIVNHMVEDTCPADGGGKTSSGRRQMGSVLFSFTVTVLAVFVML